LLAAASAFGILSDVPSAQSQAGAVTASDTLGAIACQAMIDIFRKKDSTAVDRYFDRAFVQHDPNLTDGLGGMKSFAAEVASSPSADITIYRTLVDDNFVLLHSKYQGVARFGGSVIAFDLFRFKDGKIAEHWGGQQPEEPPNLSGRTEVDGPTDVIDRERTEANRTLVRTYRETVTCNSISQRDNSIPDFRGMLCIVNAVNELFDAIEATRPTILRASYA
jgi:predicted SnoaL-like aldol condensation-catalyzing enzyme